MIQLDVLCLFVIDIGNNLLGTDMIRRAYRENSLRDSFLLPISTEVNAVSTEYFQGVAPPARTTVPAPLGGTMRIEISAIAGR